MVVGADLEVGVRLAAVPATDLPGALAPPAPGANRTLSEPSQLREMTACAFRSSSGHDALISDEITLVTYSSSGTSLTTVRPVARRRMRKAPRKTWRSFRSQWKPMPIVTSSSANAHDEGSAGVSVTA